MRKHVYVYGLDDRNMQELRKLQDKEPRSFHGLMTFKETRVNTAEGIDWLIKEGQERLRKQRHHVDAVIGYWDFPVTTTLPIICRGFDLKAPTLESVLKCEHKYWSRLEQRQAVPECTPAFVRFNPFADNCRDCINLKYPFWIKPLKSYSSQLGFKIRNKKDLDHAIKIIRRKIHIFSDPFNEVLTYAELPDEVGEASKGFCIAEQAVTGRLCTLEGHVFEGELFVHGIIDSFRYPKVSSFQRYQYPSRLPRKIQERMAEFAQRIMKQIGFDNSGFNIEFFYDEKRDKIWLLEINPRVSQSHANIFWKVDGVPNLKVSVDIALGERPDMLRRQGKYNTAAKFYYRTFKDGRVEKAPSNEQLRAIEQQYPDTIIELIAKEGDVLSDLPEQDSYSYVLAHVFVGAMNTMELIGKYKAITEMLGYKIGGTE